MKIRVLGCSGAIARGSHTTAFLVDEDILIDAGTGVCELELEAMRRIDHVFLSHSHLDHIAALPLMVDAIASHRHAPLHVHALPQTIDALRTHIFNDIIWPDFSRLPSPEGPFIRFEALAEGETVTLGARRIEAVSASHSVPAVGYAVSEGGGCWVYSGDTGPNPAFWARVNALDVRALVIETAFSNRESELARISGHLAPRMLAEQLRLIACKACYPIYITHTKPAETELIVQEIAAFDLPALSGHDIRPLGAGQVFEI
ncbi:3',5'-cyclic-nucleotide phosphodiesterase [Tibeticola sp.]|uniref:MBL fold metallo-hydrolase n=1 Tax=Tibeticola sp. TaxID=2005368 RepID=UPI0025F3300C|nr:3',5'-cyclic-nucleotide phosphodiesterase [Tibeticola sp.]